MRPAAPAGGLDGLLADPRLWRGAGRPPARSSIPSGHAALDRALGGGWPRGVVCELTLAQTGCGELGLLLPVLRRLAGSFAWIAPPHLPYPPALADAGIALRQLLLIETSDRAQAQWAAEQTLRSGACAAVLLWLPSVSTRAVRRLQLVAAASGAFMALLLPSDGSPANSPAALRVQLAPAPQGIAVHVHKRPGGWPAAPLVVEYPSGVVAGPVSAGTGARGAAGRD